MSGGYLSGGYLSGGYLSGGICPRIVYTAMSGGVYYPVIELQFFLMYFAFSSFH